MSLCSHPLNPRHYTMALTHTQGIGVTTVGNPNLVMGLDIVCGEMAADQESHLIM